VASFIRFLRHGGPYVFPLKEATPTAASRARVLGSMPSIATTNKFATCIAPKKNLHHAIVVRAGIFIYGLTPPLFRPGTYQVKTKYKLCKPDIFNDVEGLF
jgi:hypothetical protein